MKMSFPDALGELRSRSLAIAGIYREWARRLPPGSVTQLALSCAQQRTDLCKALAEIGAEPGLQGAQVEFELPLAEAPGPSAGDAALSEPGLIFRKMADAEAADHELIAAAAGAALAVSTGIAERLASEADSARKRSIWAQDQLELLAMLGPKS